MECESILRNECACELDTGVDADALVTKSPCGGDGLAGQSTSARNSSSSSIWFLTFASSPLRESDYSSSDTTGGSVLSAKAATWLLFMLSAVQGADCGVYEVREIRGNRDRRP